jgi:hypothetical protein
MELVVDPDDLDGDGIVNASDSCPLSHNPSQHDEDGDAVGDSCDVCPVIGDPAQRDDGEQAALQFGDGIGDACDPRTSRDGDVLAAFHPFTEDTSKEWIGEGWAIGADVARAVSPAHWRHRATHVGDGLYVQAHVSTLVWLSAPGSVGVTVDDEAIEGSGFTCAVARDRDADGHDEIDVHFGSALIKTESLGAPVAGPLVITAWRAIDRERMGVVFCRVVHQGVMHELLIEGLDDFATGIYSFASRGAITDVTSLVVYTFPVNPCAFSSGERQCESE